MTTRKYTACRTLGHAWDDHWIVPDVPTFDSWNVFQTATPVQFKCLRCGTIRIDLVDGKTGMVERRRYTHPLDYSIKKTEHNPTRSEWRKMFLNATMPKAAVKTQGKYPPKVEPRGGEILPPKTKRRSR